MGRQVHVPNGGMEEDHHSQVGRADAEGLAFVSGDLMLSMTCTMRPQDMRMREGGGSMHGVLVATSTSSLALVSVQASLYLSDTSQMKRSGCCTVQVACISELASLPSSGWHTAT